jgi:putative restriction endonuclease
MFAIAPTDLEWFERIRIGPIGRIVNFWTPTPWDVKGFREGDRLYFMLKAPIRKIGGFGAYVRYLDATAKDAWQLYGVNNGVDNEVELVAKISRFAKKRSKSYSPNENPVIGCIELADVVTLDDDRFIVPDRYGISFPKQVVKLKYFHVEDALALLFDYGIEASTSFSLVKGEANQKPAMRKDRKGQSRFRLDILRNYGRRCCISGDGIEELLEAAHIQPYIDERSNHPQNGLCLRVDLHRLFDDGLISLGEDLTVRVSPKLNNTSYENYSGEKIRLPAEEKHYPSLGAIKDRNKNEYRD